ncbi:MAG: hypothetical protein OEV91_07790, partial [Desulfobulbaceae bacterium]|nr:hypothetical protein [Desulfobulbaceae bacterium]
MAVANDGEKGFFMDDTRTHGDVRTELMDLDGIEGLLQQVDVMVGGGTLSPFPELEGVDEAVAAGSLPPQGGGSVVGPEAVFDELDAFETMVPLERHFKKIELVLPG